MGLWRILSIALVFSTLQALKAEAATDNACYGVSIQVQADAKEEALVELFREIRKQHRMATLLPAKRMNVGTNTGTANSAEAHYSSHAEFRCAQSLLLPTGAKLVSTRLNRNLPSGSVYLIWNEKSPVLYGAKSE